MTEWIRLSDDRDISIAPPCVHERPAPPAPRASLPRRDFILLPGIFVLTWVLIGLAGEAVARLLFPEQQLDACHVTEASGGRFQPNCRSRIKIIESGWIDNQYNECGYRSAYSCRTPAPDALRVAVLGTSISRGLWVDYERSFAGRVEHDLAAACHRPVDLQNVSQADSILVTADDVVPIWHHVADRVPEALALHPDALILAMAPFDIADYAALPGEVTGASTPPQQKSLRQQLSRLVKTIKDSLANDSRIMLLARYFAYRDPDRFVLHELGQGDSTAYLQAPFSANWRLRLNVADETIGRIATQARAAGVALIVVLMPSRTQAALSAANVDRHGTDPFALGRAIGAIVQDHGGRFIDMTQMLATLPHPAELYFEIDGHPNDAGHAALARAVEAALVGDVAGFAGCVRTDR
jgi:hypothetical protein